jgi:hypothetical protein
MSVHRGPRTFRPLVIAACAIGVIGTGYASVRYLHAGRAANASDADIAAYSSMQGTAVIVSRPEGAKVIVDGVTHGTAPVRLVLPVGQHSLQLQNGIDTRALPLVIEAGTIVREYVDLGPSAGTAPGTTGTIAASAAVAAGQGRADITSDPPGAQVSIDGTSRGVTPLTVSALAIGSHKVTITNNGVSVDRSMDVTAGGTASVVVSFSASGPSAGWVTIKSPFELQIRESGQALGSTSLDRLMLPAGRHDLELSSAAYEFKTTLTVQVQPGKTATPNLVLPKGSLSVNATPWAEVWVDGQDMGATPLGNLPVAIGTHEVIWKHPQLGERKQTIKVTAQTPVRAGMDLTK